jgi:aryl-alcohol dehydrogenase-like predicted oxidoreductase
MNGVVFTTPRTNSNARSQRRHCIQLFAPLGAVEPSDFLVDLLGKFAQQKKATPAQLALARLLAKKPWVVLIPGTTKLHRLEENLGAANVELTPEDLRAIESASSNIKVEGARYPQWLVPMSGR